MCVCLFTINSRTNTNNTYVLQKNMESHIRKLTSVCCSKQNKKQRNHNKVKNEWSRCAFSCLTMSGPQQCWDWLKPSQMKHIRNSSKTCSVHVHLDSNIQHPVPSLAIKIPDLEINHIYLPQKWFKKRLLWSPKHNPHGHMCLLAVLAGEQKSRVPALSLLSLYYGHILYPWKPGYRCLWDLLFRYL